MPTYKIIGGDQKEYGPVSAEELRQWIAEGRLNSQSLALVEHTSEWKPLALFPEFGDALSLQAAWQPPPTIAASSNPAEAAGQILAREPQLNIGECLHGGFSFLKSNTGFVFTGVLIVWLAHFLKTMTAFIPVAGGLVSLLLGLGYWLLGGVLMGGLYLACLRRLRGEPVAVSNVFDGFKFGFVQLVLAGALTSLLTQIGFAFCLLPGIYLLIAWTFALPLLADKRLEFWSAMELSRKVVTRVWIQAFFLLAVAFLPFLMAQVYGTVSMFELFFGIFGNANYDFTRVATSIQQHMPEIMAVSFRVTLVGQIVLFFNLLYAVGVITHAYENLFGARKS